MILLISNPLDKSTTLISHWLEYLGASFVSLNEIDLYQNSSLDLYRNELYVNGNKYSLLEFRSVWIRRPFSFHLTELYEYINQEVDVDLAILLREEVSTIIKYIYTFFKEYSQYFLGNSSWVGTNKLTELRVAQDVGLRIPLTIVTTRRNDLISLFRDFKHIISKSLYNSRVIHPWGAAYKMHTNRITLDDLNALPNCFAPSLFQEEILKEYDIRVFYLDGELFAMAIILDNKSSEVDYRKEDPRTMRLLPIQLSTEIATKIRAFMTQIDLKIGSLDLVKARNGDVYFLEVNHEGQFNMIDDPCNYGIHRKIAEKLIDNDRI